MNTKLDRLNQITDYWTPKILIAVLAAAFILSYAALLTLAAAAGYDWRLAWLWPLLLDGVVIFSTMSLVKRQFAGQPTGYVWFLLIVSDGLSIGLNGYAAWPNWAYVAIHAAPPLVLVLLLKAYTNDAKDDARQASAAATVADLSARVADEAAKLASIGGKIATAETRLASLKDDRKTARIAADSEKHVLKNGNAAAPIDEARAAKQTRIDDRRALVADLARQGLTQADIGRRLKAAGHAASPDTVRRDLAALGLGDGPEVVDILRAVVNDLAVTDSVTGQSDQLNGNVRNGNGGSHASH